MHASKIVASRVGAAAPLTLAVFTFALGAACSSSSSPPASGGSGSSSSSSSSGGAEDSGSAATFTRVYGDIIMKDCVTCHNPTGEGGTVGKLDMSSQSTAFTNLVGVAAAGAECSGKGTRVVAGDADMSILYQKVTTPTCGSMMPLGGAALANDLTDEIEGWINAGAKND